VLRISILLASMGLLWCPLGWDVGCPHTLGTGQWLGSIIVHLCYLHVGVIVIAEFVEHLARV